MVSRSGLSEPLVDMKRNLFGAPTTHTKLIASYIFIIVSVTTIIGITTYRYSTAQYNEENEEANNQLLAYFARQFDERIYGVASQVYLQVASSLTEGVNARTHIDSWSKPSSLQLYARFLRLNEICNSQSEAIRAVGLLLPGPRVYLSSRMGVKFLARDANESYPLDWLRSATGPGAARLDLWIPTRREQLIKSPPDSSGAAEVFSYVRAYRSILDRSAPQAFIEVDFDERSLSDIIRQPDGVYGPPTRSTTIIVDREGDVVSHNSTSLFHSELSLRSCIQRIVTSPSSNGSFTFTIEGTRCVVSFTSFRSNDWRIARIAPFSELYARAIKVRRVLAIVCLVAILFGVGTAEIFASFLYRPLQRILATIRGYFDSMAPEPYGAQNEYRTIEYTLGTLHTKVSDLEGTIARNQPLIKYSLVMRLLGSTISDKQELTDLLQLQNVSHAFSYFNAVRLAVHRGYYERVDLRSMQAAKLDMILCIEAQSTANCLFLAIEDSTLTVIGIVLADELIDDQLSAMLHRTLDSASEKYGLRLDAAAGSWVREPHEVHRSYADALAAMRYRYLFPKERVYYSDQYRAQERSRKVLPGRLHLELARSLNERDTRKVQKVIARLVAACSSGAYSLATCRQAVSDFTTVLSEFIQRKPIARDDLSEHELLEAAERHASLFTFKRWFLRTVGEAFSRLEALDASHRHEVIQKALAYVGNNLHDPLLSLTVVATHCSMSPGYLSRLLREETKMTFPDNVCARRLVKARELLQPGTMTIEEIARRVGFNTPHYFIRKFKQTYGVTPKSYRELRSRDGNAR